MINFYPTKKTDLRHQVDHISLEKIELFEEWRTDLGNARIFVILNRHREIKMVSVGYKNSDIKII